MISRVEVDDSELVRAMHQLGAGIDTGAQRAAEHEAAATASEIRNRVPKRTGRLQSTVRAVHDAEGAGVTYGGGLPYAAYIERRTGAVAAGVEAGARRFPPACARVADQEARRI